MGRPPGGRFVAGAVLCLKYVCSVNTLSTEYSHNSVDRLLIHHRAEMPSLVPPGLPETSAYSNCDYRCDFLTEQPRIAAVKLSVVDSNEFVLQFGCLYVAARGIVCQRVIEASEGKCKGL